MSSPADVRKTTCPSDVEGGLSPSGSPMQHANTSAMQLPDDPSLGSRMHRTRLGDIVRNGPVSIEMSASGWIIITALSVIRFMAKTTGSEVKVRFLAGS